MSFKFVSPLVSLKRTNDVFSKHILSRKEHKAFLIDLLNAVIFDKGRHPEDEKILDVFLEDRVLSPRVMTKIKSVFLILEPEQESVSTPLKFSSTSKKTSEPALITMQPKS